MGDHSYEQESVDDSGSYADDPDDVAESYSQANDQVNRGFGAGGEVFF